MLQSLYLQQIPRKQETLPEKTDTQSGTLKDEIVHDHIHSKTEKYYHLVVGNNRH